MQEGYCQVTENSPTVTGCVLHTYVYQVWDLGGTWYPCAPEDVVLQYRLWGIPKGNITPRGPDEGKRTSDSVPEGFAIESIHPNPFNSSATIGIYNPVAGRVSISIFDLLGREIKEVAITQMAAGRQSITWDGRDSFGNGVSSGLYYCRVESAGQVAWGKLMLLR